MKARRRAARALALVFCRETGRHGVPCYQCVDSAERLLTAAGVVDDSQQDVPPVVESLVTIRCQNMREHVGDPHEFRSVTEPKCPECTSIVSISVCIPGQSNVRATLTTP